ncbi:MAG: SAM-dependent methyltransferase [Proteobacteria bacterium]|nr:SAM-dependent methyltransferase [Pseudomonadota bacterium]
MLPALTGDEARHSAALTAAIAAEIAAAGGWLSFERFMELALYAPGLGYYSAGSHKIGAGGDFTTAPEMSDLFSGCVARQCAEVLAASGGDILELGAGSGRMAEAILTALAAHGPLPEHYSILEVSADLAERQRARLEALPASLRARVRWLTGLPSGFRGVMLANEVADALPCRRFVVRGGRVRELGVVAGPSGALGEAESDAAPALAQQIGRLEAELGAALPEGYVSEVCLRADAWVASLAHALESGALLLFDYGLPRRHYYHSERATGTLHCHFRQLVHDDPYVNVGVQDITAWVDFTRLALAGTGAGLSLGGFTTQAAFLLATGLEAAVAEAPSDVERARRAGEARRLVMPEEMGEAFKVLALTRAIAQPLSGFALQDLSHLL